MNNIQKVSTFIATLGPVGYLPASGTIASLITLFLLYTSSPYISPCWMPSIVISFVGVSLILVHYALRTFAVSDPRAIVIDEVAGFMFSAYLFPRTLVWLCAGFVIFRFFDIVKPLGIKRLERIPGAAGVVLDDLLAGLYTQATLIGGTIIYALWTGH